MAEPIPWTYLTDRRRRSGRTQTALAAAIQVSVAYISMLEAGLRRPSPEMFTRLAAALEVDFDELYYSAPQNVPPQVSARHVVAL